ncbi:MAG TPA: hypothetical protein VEL05_01160 [Candidatus Acidoferrum sp.]|nr:hypothetical protein [Candidatus Acidoferrum sp.]
MLWARHSLLVFTLMFVAASAPAGCDRSGDERRGLPPASDWKPPATQASEIEGAGRPRGHEAGEEPTDDPHAGLDMGGEADPRASRDGDQDPHADLDMGEMGDGAGEEGGDGADPDMAGLKAPDPDRPIDPSKFLRGTIRVGKDVSAAISPGSVLFLSARPIDPATGQTLGAPLAVAKLTVDKLPAPFELTERDMMVRGTRFEGDVLVSARVDRDGEARTKEPGDVEGSVRARIPAQALDLVLDTALR